MPAVAEAFSWLAQRALEQGVLHGYRSTEESLPVLRGRLRESEQLRRRFGGEVIEAHLCGRAGEVGAAGLLVADLAAEARWPGIRLSM